ncbi:TIGR03085 family metal-binding protein [Ornithinimicrobium sp. F0845]|uniref:TIGR03085 family metal-binding protein n=1 Tax=Ornithinimicrobium sp. F0845 TaxID=2926412 RepID=UPI001FF150F7|nr:TIGR03085 family metal-binding protein [Ornithinimicrobium sp. F0845]MCK0110540.1 TIGR03085 family metal-binding protein [Ornithinimicrobium sp. F0845]
MTHLAGLERQALCDTLERVGPSAPTLCDPWLSAELAAHLVIRDTRPDLAMAGIIPPLKGKLDAGMAEYATRPWDELVHLVRNGPPAWSPARIPALDHLVNLTEFFIHHEDVLRGDGRVGPQRDISQELESTLWRQLTTNARLMLARLDCGVVLVARGHGRKAVKRPTVAGAVVLMGSPGELTLAVSGRLRVAHVGLGGAESAVELTRTIL